MPNPGEGGGFRRGGGCPRPETLRAGASPAPTKTFREGPKMQGPDWRGGRGRYLILPPQAPLGVLHGRAADLVLDQEGGQIPHGHVVAHRENLRVHQVAGGDGSHPSSPVLAIVSIFLRYLKTAHRAVTAPWRLGAEERL